MSHVFYGLMFVTFRFPGWSPVRRNSQNRRWSRKLLRILSIRLHVDNLPEIFPERCLLIINHVSWLDIVLVNAAHPALFIAKSEIARWPMVGSLATRAGTLYIDRGSRGALRRTNQRVSQALLEGELVACFPEGITSYGEDVGRFHAALFQPAIDAKAMVAPAVIRYLDMDGQRCKSAAYVGEDSLAKSIWMLVSTQRLVAKLEFLSPITAEKRERRELSAQIQDSISRCLRNPEYQASTSRPGYSLRP